MANTGRSAVLLYSAVFISLLVLVQCQEVCREVPAKFLGRFVVDHSENLEEYLIARGYSWLKRKLAIHAKPTQIFTKSASVPCAYDLTYKSLLKNMHWPGFRLDIPFKGAYLDSKEYTIIYNYDQQSDKLVRRQMLPGEPPILAEFYFSPDGYLVLASEYKGVTSRVYFRRIQ
ncbi:CBN-LBP-1 protein [Aphelenchoides avenae]|nr:CBN-LBP-1 protein [Aphelenchus avenae]